MADHQNLLVCKEEPETENGYLMTPQDEPSNPNTGFQGEQTPFSGQRLVLYYKILQVILEQTKNSKHAAQNVTDKNISYKSKTDITCRERDVTSEPRDASADLARPLTGMGLELYDRILQVILEEESKARTITLNDRSSHLGFPVAVKEEPSSPAEALECRAKDVQPDDGRFELETLAQDNNWTYSNALRNVGNFQVQGLEWIGGGAADPFPDCMQASSLPTYIVFDNDVVKTTSYEATVEYMPLSRTIDDIVIKEENIEEPAFSNSDFVLEADPPLNIPAAGNSEQMCTDWEETSGFGAEKFSSGKQEGSLSCCSVGNDGVRSVMRFDCSVCGKQYETPKELDRHVRSHDKESNFKCKDCGKCFTRQASLQSHMVCHKEHQCWQCEKCGRWLSSKRSLELHVDRVHFKRYPCYVCKLYFSSRSEWEAHSYGHLTGDIYACNICKKHFARLCYLESHMVTHCHQEFTCEECKKVFSRKSSLKVHYRIVHLKDLCYLCETCGRGFHAPSLLRLHRRAHRRKRFACSICGKSFRKESRLRSHMCGHNVEHPHACNICGKAFRTAKGLARHRCGYRSKKFLTRHPMQVHIGRSRYRCEFCQKAFVTRQELKQHSSSHSVHPASQS